MEKYYILKEEISEIEILKSKFISILIPIENEEEIAFKIKELKKIYPKAKHYIYAYIFDNKQKSNDDGEPSGTAGKPTLDLLNKANLNKVLLVTIRYFGGVKLGASRLLRTYVDSANICIKKSIKYILSNKYVYCVETKLQHKSIFIEICALNNISIDKMIYNIDTILFDISSYDDVSNILKCNQVLTYKLKEIVKIRKEV